MSGWIVVVFRSCCCGLFGLCSCQDWLDAWESVGDCSLRTSHYGMDMWQRMGWVDMEYQEAYGMSDGSVSVREEGELD